jgi:hypothetical protein
VTVASHEYRRKKGADDHPWHFCTNCKQWPTEGYDATSDKVRPVCEQCLSLERRQMCAKEDAYL